MPKKRLLSEHRVWIFACRALDSKKKNDQSTGNAEGGMRES